MEILREWRPVRIGGLLPDRTRRVAIFPLQCTPNSKGLTHCCLDLFFLSLYPASGCEQLSKWHVLFQIRHQVLGKLTDNFRPHLSDSFLVILKMQYRYFLLFQMLRRYLALYYVQVTANFTYLIGHLFECSVESRAVGWHISIYYCVIKPKKRSGQRLQRSGPPWTAVEEGSTSFGLWGL
jgi:hypothetical protein